MTSAHYKCRIQSYQSDLWPCAVVAVDVLADQRHVERRCQSHVAKELRCHWQPEVLEQTRTIFFYILCTFGFQYVNFICKVHVFKMWSASNLYLYVTVINVLKPTLTVALEVVVGRGMEVVSSSSNNSPTVFSSSFCMDSGPYDNRPASSAWYRH